MVYFTGHKRDKRAQNLLKKNAVILSTYYVSSSVISLYVNFLKQILFIYF